MLFKAHFTIDAQALYNTLPTELFGFARDIAYVARALAFVACVFVIESSLLKIVGMHTIQKKPNGIQIIAMQRLNISTKVLLRFGQNLAVSVTVLCHQYVLETRLFSPPGIFASTYGIGSS